jgi:3-hydroxyacyl-[acyl-carrier-protein] dehydratase
VDRVLEWEYGKYAVGYKCVTINDNFFPGHFPQRAIMPGAPRRQLNAGVLHLGIT